MVAKLYLIQRCYNRPLPACVGVWVCVGGWMGGWMGSFLSFRLPSYQQFYSSRNIIVFYRLTYTMLTSHLSSSRALLTVIIPAFAALNHTGKEFKLHCDTTQTVLQMHARLHIYYMTSFKCYALISVGNLMCSLVSRWEMN